MTYLMASADGGPPLKVVGPPLLTNPSEFPFLGGNNSQTLQAANKDVTFSDLLQSQEESLEAPTKSVSYVDGIPHIQWTALEVEQMNIKEDLQYAVVGKFAHVWPEMDDLREAIPKQCNIKSKCKIGLFRN
ncbi:hypothetical protein KY290_031449 [Solanum tuberosum]|uniref:DUF4283 domain-containing protein n=1 Tax=Solanum tuberosum TaxID=4113 RepID=A0ABQ7U977_SOLTU|nr:hypothetical protein KY290_031449 [Solanum tuberosum]